MCPVRVKTERPGASVVDGRVESKRCISCCRRFHRHHLGAPWHPSRSMGNHRSGRGSPKGCMTGSWCNNRTWRLYVKLWNWTLFRFPLLPEEPTTQPHVPTDTGVYTSGVPSSSGDEPRRVGRSPGRVPGRDSWEVLVGPGRAQIRLLVRLRVSPLPEGTSVSLTVRTLYC